MLTRYRIGVMSQLHAVFLAAFFTVLPSVVSPVWAQGNLIHPIPKGDVIRPQTLGELFPYKDDTATMGQEDLRTPVILIHGIGAEQDRNYFNWARFLEFVDAHQDFDKQFKVYLYRYDSTQSVPALSAGLQDDLRRFITGLDGRKIRIMAYSEGGLLTRNALQDPVINASTERVITIATPFHGSPLANRDWLKQQLKEDSPLSPVRMTNGLSYWIAKKKYPSFEADFHWDNFDSAIDREAYTGRGELEGYVAAYSDKLITYGSYFGEEVDPEQTLPKALGLNNPLPKEKHRFRMPWSRHFMFTLVRKNISALPLAYLPFKKKANPKNAPENLTPKGTTPSDENNLVLQGDQITVLPKDIQDEVLAMTAVESLPISGVSATHEALKAKANMMPLMVYNDGISPISSSLWLGRFTHQPHSKKGEGAHGQMWQALKHLQGTNQARLLPGLDHRDWMDGSTRYHTNLLPDLLHPKEAPRTTFEWLLMDLTSERVHSMQSGPVSMPPAEEMPTPTSHPEEDRAEGFRPQQQAIN